MDAFRDQRGVTWLDDLVRDVRYGRPHARQEPTFTAVAVLSLAMGIGANSAVFSWADALLLRPLPIPRAGDVIAVGSPEAVASTLRTSYPDYLHIQERSRSFDGLAAFTRNARRRSEPDAAADSPRLSVRPAGERQLLLRSSTSQPPLGRSVGPHAGEASGGDAAIVLGHDMWERQFGGGPIRSLAAAVRLNGD